MFWQGFSGLSLKQGTGNRGIRESGNKIKTENIRNHKPKVQDARKGPITYPKIKILHTVRTSFNYDISTMD